MRICMLLHKSVVHDSRVRREAKALAAAGHEVTVAHLAPADVPAAVAAEGYRVVSVLPPRLGRRRLPFALHRLAFMRRFVGAIRALKPDAVHAHDAAMLAPGYAGARLTGARLVYDSHELATGVAYRGRVWARFVWTLERLFVPRCDAVITVSDGIAERLKDLYALRQRPAVVRNVSDLVARSKRTDLRGQLGLPDGAPLVLHQGAAARGRGCETLVAAMSHLPEAHLLFLGDHDPGYRERLDAAAARADVRGRVHFLPSVPLEEMLEHTAEADAGVSLLEATCENHRQALPNKVFEYITAGVPVVVSDLPELRRVAQDYGVGETADPTDPQDVARAVRGVLQNGRPPVETLAQAAATLRWDEEQRQLTEVYERLDSRHARALVFVRNPCTHDARVLREARVLKGLGMDTMVVGVTSTGDPDPEARVDGIDVLRLSPGGRSGGVRRATVAAALPAAGPPVAPVRASLRRRLARFAVTLDWYRRGIALVRRERPALVHCNDYNTMWIGMAAKAMRARVVYDSHELWPDRNLRPEARPWLLACEFLFVRFADEVVTTSPAYARVMARRYRIPPPKVVRNIPDVAPSSERWASRAADPPVAVYFGAVTRGRGLEQMIAALPLVPPLRLRIVGPEAWSFRSHLERLVRERDLLDRVELHNAISPADGWRMMSDAAFGLALIEPVCLSYELTLPNKLFEYVHAGIPVLGTQLPQIAEFIHSHDVGLTVGRMDPETVAGAVESMLSPTLNHRFRRAAVAAARELTWEAERRTLSGLYRIPVDDMDG